MVEPEPTFIKNGLIFIIMVKKKWYQRIILYGVFVLLISFSNLTYGQTLVRQCVSSYANVSSTTNIAVNQTIGQCYSTVSKSASGATILQGFQQPVRFSVESEKNSLLNQLDLSVYPNPATYNVNIMSQEMVDKLSIRVVDMSGKIIQVEDVYDFQTYSINCESWLNGTYFISVSDNNKKTRTLKLIILK